MIKRGISVEFTYPKGDKLVGLVLMIISLDKMRSKNRFDYVFFIINYSKRSRA